MHRLLPLLLLALASSVSAQAGIRLSSGLSEPTGAIVELDSDPIVGLAAFVKAPLSDQTAFVLEAGLAQATIDYKIFRTTDETPEVDLENPLFYDAHTRAHLLSVAPGLRYQIGQGQTTPYLLAGPRIDIKLLERSKVEANSGPSGFFAPFMFGGAAGAGVALTRFLGVDGVYVDLRGSYLLGTRFGASGEDLGNKAVELRLGFTL